MICFFGLNYVGKDRDSMKSKALARYIKFICFIMISTVLFMASGCGEVRDDDISVEAEEEAMTSPQTDDNGEASAKALAEPTVEVYDDISNKNDEQSGDRDRVTSGAGSYTEESIEIDTQKISYEDMQLIKRVKDKMEQMTLEEKVAQMFIVFPESLVKGVNHVTMATETTQKSIDAVPVGGVVYMTENLVNPDQTKEMLSNIQRYSMERIELPLFLCVDEEGGRIARIANNKMYGVDNVGSMTEYGIKNDPNQAYIAGVTMGSYLSELGFNLDFAPDVDVQGVKVDSVFYRRTFSDDPVIVASMADAVAKGLKSKGIVTVYKHFPGHGSTTGDPHKGYAISDKTIDDLKKDDLIPFEKGIDENVPCIMIGHISLPKVTGDDTPASLSKEIVTGLLRKDLGYNGIVVTDAMNMGAIKDNYDSDEAALLAVEAGVDVVLMPKDFDKAYNGILTAVKNGNVSVERIDESVERILKVKMGFIN